MGIFVDLPTISNEFFSSFHDFKSGSVDSNFQVDEEGELYFLIEEGLVKIKNKDCSIYKFKKKVEKFAKLLIVENEVVCFIGSKIYFINKDNLEEQNFLYDNIRKIFGQPCIMGEDIYFTDAISVKKLSIKNKKMTEIYRFKVEGKILPSMSDIIVHNDRIVFYDRRDSLVFIDRQGIIEKRIQFPIKEIFVSKDDLTNLKNNPTKFSSVKDGNYRVRMNIELNSLPILHKNMLFMKGEKSAICIDPDLQYRFLRTKEKVETLIPNKKSISLKPIKDIRSVSLRERTRYNFEFKNHVYRFYKEDFSVILRDRVLSIKTKGSFKDYLIDQHIDTRDIFAWILDGYINIVIMDSYGEIYKFKVDTKYSPSEDDFDIKVKPSSPGFLRTFFTNVKKRFASFF